MNEALIVCCSHRTKLSFVESDLVRDVRPVALAGLVRMDGHDKEGLIESQGYHWTTMTIRSASIIEDAEMIQLCRVNMDVDTLIRQFVLLNDADRVPVLVRSILLDRQLH